MEQICDELARDIGEDRAEEEAIKRESLKVEEQIEHEIYRCSSSLTDCVGK